MNLYEIQYFGADYMRRVDPVITGLASFVYN